MNEENFIPDDQPSDWLGKIQSVCMSVGRSFQARMGDSLVTITKIQFEGNLPSTNETLSM